LDQPAAGNAWGSNIGKKKTARARVFKPTISET